MKIIKRDGRIVEYDHSKIENAIMHANNDVADGNRANKRQIDNIIKHIEELNKKRMLVEDIQDMIETELMKIKKYDLARAYIIYRYKRALVRKSNIKDESILSLIKNPNHENNHKEKKNLLSIKRDLIASEVSKDLTKRVLLPEKISESYKNGALYFHNDDYFLQPFINSCLVNYPEIFENDVIINNNKLDKPTDFLEACSLLAQIILNIGINQYGEQAIDIKYLSKYLKMTCEKYHLNKNAELFKNHLVNGIKIIFYQINSLVLTKEKSPKITLFLELDNDYTELIIEEILNQYQKIFKDNQGLPNIVYLLDENNTQTDSQNYYLTEKAIEIINNHLPITFISKKIMMKNFNNHAFSPMGKCHLLPPLKDKNQLKYLGRFNQGIVSINLPQIALEVNGDEEKFWLLLDERLDLCFEALMCRHHALLGTGADTSPIHWQNGAIAKLNEEEKIDNLLKNDYSTLSLGYIGLDETTKIIKKESLIMKNGEKFALKLLKYIKSTCDSWKKETGLNFVLYGNPSDELGKYFIDIDKEKYGLIKNITDKKSYNISHNINEKMDNYAKIKLLSQFQNLCSGGDMTYINLGDEDIHEIIKYAYENIQCIEINKFKGEL